MEKLEVIELEFTPDELAAMEENDSLPIDVVYKAGTKPEPHRRD